MEYKTPKNSKPKIFGFTLIEFLITFSIVMILTSISYIMFNPIQNKRRGRDQRRLSDVALLERMINEYKIDNDAYPDPSGVLRLSTSLPIGNPGPLSDPSQGWFSTDLSIYNTRLPIDPTNDTNYFYSYENNGFSYEINARLEYNNEQEQNDGGNDTNVYEVGDDLTII